MIRWFAIRDPRLLELWRTIRALSGFAYVAQDALVCTHDLRQPDRQMVARAHVLTNVGYQVTVALTANDFFARRARYFLGHPNLLSSRSP
jgi:hypothetical protein